MDVEYLLKWCYRYKSHIKNLSHTQEYQKILQLTSFLPDDVRLAQRMWHLKNQIFEVPKCKICGESATWQQGFKYNNSCSKECQYKLVYNKTISDEILDCSDDILIEWHNKNKLVYYKYKNDPHYSTIIHRTFFLPQSVKFTQRIWHLKNQIFEVPKCRICGENVYGVHFDNNNMHYNLTCSQKCFEKYKKSQEFIDKQSKTTKKRYGYDFTGQVPEFIKKKEQNNIKKYGTPYTSQVSEYKEKRKNTTKERYGVENIAKSKTIKQNFIEKSEWFQLIQQNECFVKYIKHIDGRIHLLECKICGEQFECISNNSRIFNNHVLCPICNPIEKFYSSSEKDLLSFVSSIYGGEIEENIKSVIPPYEIDIYLPKLLFAIEFNGVYWHSDLYNPDDYHKVKTELCEKVGVRLIHVFEDDWNFKQEIIKSIISNIISPQNNHKIQARKCEIREVNLQQTNDFLEQSHIQGGIMNFSTCYGLYCDDTLVSLMSFKKSGSGFELQRYGIKLGHTIVGGAEKLFTHFVRTHDPEFVITYADISLFTGKVYEKLGFTKIRRNEPNYMFVDGDHRIPKQSIRKLRQGYKRENDPFPRIYNSGIDKWEWKPKIKKLNNKSKNDGKIYS